MEQSVRVEHLTCSHESAGESTVVLGDVGLSVEQVGRVGENLRSVLCKNDGCVGGFGGLPEDRSSFRCCFSHDNRCVVFDDARFFGGNFSERVSQKLRVVKADVGDD